MDPIRAVTLVHAKDHPVLDRPLSWRVDDIHMHLVDRGAERVRVVLAVSRGNEGRALRFDGVADFTIAGGIVGATVRVLDVTHLQWRGIDFRVETTCGGLGFWAGSVSDEPPDAGQGDALERLTERAVKRQRRTAGRSQPRT